MLETKCSFETGIAHTISRELGNCVIGEDRQWRI
jgi:hypothetical protein